MIDPSFACRFARKQSIWNKFCFILKIWDIFKKRPDDQSVFVEFIQVQIKAFETFCSCGTRVAPDQGLHSSRNKSVYDMFEHALTPARALSLFSPEQLRLCGLDTKKAALIDVLLKSDDIYSHLFSKSIVAWCDECFDASCYECPNFRKLNFFFNASLPPLSEVDSIRPMYDPTLSKRNNSKENNKYKAQYHTRNITTGVVRWFDSVMSVSETTILFAS